MILNVENIEHCILVLAFHCSLISANLALVVRCNRIFNYNHSNWI